MAYVHWKYEVAPIVVDSSLRKQRTRELPD
jgi:hypothetical protein